MQAYASIRALNQKLARGQTDFSDLSGLGAASFPELPRHKVLSYPRIGVYRGKGASHSWLWFVEVLERMGFYGLCFPHEGSLQADILDRVDVLAVSGGDTFAIAEGLGPKGASNLAHFIHRGGLYVGSCAGAYLPLHSSKPFLNLFNYVPVKISNLTPVLPEVHLLREKCCTAYGCAYIFHPVREAVRLQASGFPPFRDAGSFTAPLYGGPPMVASDPDMVAATYAGFTPKTLFLVDEPLARETLLGRAAVIRSCLGEGHLHLYGPHFEHPGFPLANTLLAKALYYDLPPAKTLPSETEPDGTGVLTGRKSRAFLRSIRREISNARIVAVGLETLPLQWTIGKKVYEAGKIRVFLEAIWSRLRHLERSDPLCLPVGQDRKLLQILPWITRLVREIRRGVDQGADTGSLAKELFPSLNEACVLFLEMYFETRARAFRREP